MTCSYSTTEINRWYFTEVERYNCDWGTWWKKTNISITIILFLLLLFLHLLVVVIVIIIIPLIFWYFLLPCHLLMYSPFPPFSFPSFTSFFFPLPPYHPFLCFLALHLFRWAFFLTGLYLCSFALLFLPFVTFFTLLSCSLHPFTHLFFPTFLISPITLISFLSLNFPPLLIPLPFLSPSSPSSLLHAYDPVSPKLSSVTP